MAFKKEIEVIIEPKEIFVGKKDAPVTLMVEWWKAALLR